MFNNIKYIIGDMQPDFRLNSLKDIEIFISFYNFLYFKDMPYIDVQIYTS